MVKDELFDFLREVGLGLVGIGAFVFITAIAIVEVSETQLSSPISYSSVASLILATVAITSLYVAWKELIRKTRTNLTTRFYYEYPPEEDVPERLVVKITNSGANVITLGNMWYGVVKREGDSYYLTNGMMDIVEEDGLQPGETAELVVGDSIVSVQLIHANGWNWRGEHFTEEYSSEEMKTYRPTYVKSGNRIDIKLQKIFEAVMDQSIRTGTRISIDELEKYSADKLIEEHASIER